LQCDATPGPHTNQSLHTTTTTTTTINHNSVALGQANGDRTGGLQDILRLLTLWFNWCALVCWVGGWGGWGGVSTGLVNACLSLDVALPPLFLSSTPHSTSTATHPPPHDHTPRGSAPAVEEALQEGFGLVSIDTWLAVIPQIIARIHTNNVQVRRGVVVLCCAVLCCAVLCCAVLCCAVLCCAATF